MGILKPGNLDNVRASSIQRMEITDHINDHFQYFMGKNIKNETYIEID